MKIHLPMFIALLAIIGCHSPASFSESAVKDLQPGSAATAVAPLRTGDEGMWTFDNLPLGYLKERYDFAPSPEWLRHVQLSAVRIGASGAFVSANGLILTNHHVALGHLQQLSRPDKDCVRDGFSAHSFAEELRCPAAEINVLISMEDVTQRVMGAIDSSAAEDQQNKSRKAEIARIEKESTEQSGLKSSVVTLYQGGQYVLHRYKKYTDVRLVMAPPLQAAFFGGDYDNFTYPRFCLDFAFYRVYEDDKPARIEHFFRFNPAGAKEGELVFVVGHPGHTNRLRTVAELEYDRDYRLPTSIQNSTRRRKALGEYAARGAEQARQVQSAIFGVENGLKATIGYYEGLRDSAVFQRLAANEDALRKQIALRPELAASTADSFDRIAAVLKKAAARRNQSTYYSLGGSRLLSIATQIVRYAEEVPKPNEKRYEEYRDSNLESLRHQLYSPAPIYPELEEFSLAYAFSESANALGADDPLIVAALGGRDPKTVAHELISGTKLADPAVRRALVDGGKPAVQQFGDPLIQFARRLDPIWRELRDWQESNIQSVEALEGQRIAKARFAVYGRSTYPDATGTLRLSPGRVLGYELGTTLVPYKTTFYDLLGRAASFDNKAPFNLPGAIVEHRQEINLGTPLNFVSTNDIIGGNSGSPVINRNGEYVGLIFDGNIQSLVWAYVYGDQAGRSISVHAGAIAEALRTIYPNPELLKELTGR